MTGPGGTVAPGVPQDATLPPHAAEALALFADTGESLWWRFEPGGAITFWAECSDTFLWATAECEQIRPEDMALLRRCDSDLRRAGAEDYLAVLFASRKRGTRPMSLWLDRAGPAARARCHGRANIPKVAPAGPRHTSVTATLTTVSSG